LGIASPAFTIRLSIACVSQCGAIFTGGNRGGREAFSFTCLGIAFCKRDPTWFHQ
jgi:hypothetical protein